MKYRPRIFIDTPPRHSSHSGHSGHSGRPGPWSQLPWRILGMLFIATLLILSQQHRTSLGADPAPAPASDSRTASPAAP